ncbi:FAD-linked oxidase C-terminal domain-containing protein [Tsukamurella sp. 8F]|uniref:FAD-binding oxidoreductase n=1 Tax=unclassified Tsukamurella TaxID=2633480 RepID=UPI0023B9156A|nr:MULTISPECIES: FAD-linked oxidase C-terminal domain-containing protein [unclassified Tsukamurella]MDF0530777.1 FAD-linked oxidase C-terminal domain-containing protein [Tsukamurella sp. 8J]MDF0588303.1 FAD-linked oxidase C-terminal domain-containing protein [Tsukamurella sp. 8F]
MTALPGDFPTLRGSVLTDPDVTAAYSNDHCSPVRGGVPLAVVVAECTDDVSRTARWCYANDVVMIPRGGGSGLAGGASALDGCVIISLAKMNAIREISAPDQYAVAEAGVINADLDAAAREHGLMYPPDPSSLMMCTIGGNVATNAGGLRCVKYGVTREYVLGLEVVLPDGRVLETGRRTVKGVTGYDITQLLCGSEGTLGIVTTVTVKLKPAPAHRPTTIAASFPDVVCAASAVAAVVASGVTPALMELMDRRTLEVVQDLRPFGLEDSTIAMLIGQASTPEDAAVLERKFEAAGAHYVVVSDDQAETDELLAVRRAAFHAYENAGNIFSEDVGVPRSKLPEMFARIEAIAAKYGVDIPTCAHAGDGNLHPTLIYPHDVAEVPQAIWDAADEVFTAALELGGTLTGEHGVGVLKARWTGQELGEDVLGLHRGIKAVFDPKNLLNPGRAF